MSVRSTDFVSYKLIDSQGNLRDKIVRSGKKLKNTFFDGSSFGFMPTNKSDLMLVPDLESEHYDPIRKMRSVFCFIRSPDNKEIDGDFRTMANRAMNEDDQTIGALFGVEPEFFVCKYDGDDYIPADYQDVSEFDTEEQYKWYGCLPPLDSFQPIREKISKYLECVGIDIEAIHHEVAPGQCEFSWKCANLLKTADQMMLFKYIVTYVCSTFEFEADFRAKPFSTLNGSGCHVHQSLPIMNGDESVKYVEAYAQGLVDHYDELLKVCCVGDTSEDRLVPGFEAPTKDNNGFGWHDRTKTVRIPGEGGRMELRLPDPEMNPYVALPVMLGFGYAEIRKVLNEDKGHAC